MKKYKAVILSVMLAAFVSVPAVAATEERLTGDNASAKIEVLGEPVSAAYPDTVISADIEWEELTFTYKDGSNKWDTEEHRDVAAGGTWLNEPKTFTVTNHSNTAIKVSFAFDGAVSGLKGSFTGLSGGAFILDNANGTQYASAPSKKTALSVIGNGIAENKKIGTVTVTVASEEG